ncbi:MAG: isochorismate synthase, partial [Okeania sp. SIO2D1]|nr:isochorismate synthase [Okeania sp. SIO2D1]
YQLLLACQQKSQSQGSTQIVSLSQEIPCIDPLAIFQTIDTSKQLHFYWQNYRRKEAIAGYGATKVIKVDGKERFGHAQKFIKDCLKQVVKKGNLHLRFAGPHFFCSFTFFAEPINSPFPSATIFLPSLQIARHKNRCVLVANFAIDTQINLAVTVEEIKKQIKQINWSNYLNFDQPKQSLSLSKPLSLNQNSQQFKLAVASVLKSIQEQKFSKIVLAHNLNVISPANFQLAASLHNLRTRHRDCCIFSTSNGQGDYFIGASPERLVSIRNSHLVTDAIAGSAPRGKNHSEDQRLAKSLLNSVKEKREHQAVSEFIIQRLVELGLRPQRLPLHLLQLSNIQHLWTPINSPLPKNINPLEIVAQLHPTPAVAGVPTNVACEQICMYENFERGLYAAPLGWINHRGNGEFIVGIRSALINNNQAQLYAGAGIVAGSEPNKEFAEVQIKLQAMLKTLIQLSN